MSKTVKQMLAEAKAAVPAVDIQRARDLIADGALVVDTRDTSELASGKVRGALHVPRGMIEFRADPETDSHNPEFRKDRPVLLYCASGGRSALAGQTLRQMGYDKVYNLGGFKDWVAAGGETEPA
ncbi:MAG: rhodanese-like domain-containing protein [Pseudooceanicola sp.]|nr:rhodanese-like domain-containing protein [Pseudooceanicola sp.]MCB1356221.1 rhodanese-like domain-containing protein [Maritimibacter sp.]